MSDGVAGAAQQVSRFPGGGGSLRDARAYDRIIQATLDLLDEVGFAKLTVEAVASRSGVAKPTIYRWWKNKTHLVYEAAIQNTEVTGQPASGDFKTELRHFLERSIAFLWRPEILASHVGLLADLDIATMLDEQYVEPGRTHFA